MTRSPLKDPSVGREFAEVLTERARIKARVKALLGGSDSDAEFIDATARSLLAYYTQLNKYTHRNQKHEESLRSLLHAGEGLIRFLLVQVRIRRDEA